MEKKEAIVRRGSKDSLFCDLFSDRERALSLYNAINGTSYDDPGEMEIVTLKDVIYLHRKNDVSFLFDSRLTLWEHQSTYNPNMPLRGLQYYARNMDGILGGERRLLYRKSLVKIPAPAYYVLYNGADDVPERTELKLSDAFKTPAEGYEWTAVMLNINAGHNADIMDRCPALKGYATLIDYARGYQEQGYGAGAALDKAVKRCIDEGYLSDYLGRIRGEAVNMLLTEFDEKAWEEAVREDGFDDGVAEGEKKADEDWSSLLTHLMDDGRQQDIRLVATDTAYRKKLLREYGIG